MTRIKKWWISLFDADRSGSLDFMDLSRWVFLGLSIFMVIHERHDGEQFTDAKFIVVVACAGLVEVIVRLVQAKAIVIGKKNENS